jgi:single-strand DNA-binding protein
MYNHLSILGRATKDAEIRYLDSGKAVAKFTIAADQQGKKGDADKTDFFDVEVWGKQAEFVSEWVKKGAIVAAGGRYESRKHEGKTYWTLKAETVNPFIGPKQDKQAGDLDEVAF